MATNNPITYPFFTMEDKEKCKKCDEILDLDVGVVICTRESGDEMTLCADCWTDCKKDLRKEGWKCDQDEEEEEEEEEEEDEEDEDEEDEEENARNDAQVEADAEADAAADKLPPGTKVKVMTKDELTVFLQAKFPDSNLKHTTKGIWVTKKLDSLHLRTFFLYPELAYALQTA